MRLGEGDTKKKVREEGEQCELPFPELCLVRCESRIPREGLSGHQRTVTRAVGQHPHPLPWVLAAV